MNIETLKRAAEFMGEAWYTDHSTKPYRIYRAGKLFNPHEDANLLKKMEEKLSPGQWETYKNLLYGEFRIAEEFDWMRWFKTAPTKLCFEKLMECI